MKRKVVLLTGVFFTLFIGLLTLTSCSLIKGFINDVENNSTKSVNSTKIVSTDEEYITITYDSNGGSTVASEKVKKGSYVNLSTTTRKPTEEVEYEFLGWYYDKELTQKVTSTIFNKDLTLYAGWKEIKEYSVYLYTKDYTSYTEIKVKRGDKLSNYLNAIDDLNLDEIEGWYLDSRCTNKFDLNSAINEIVILYPKIKEINVEIETIKVSFETNGGTTIDPQYVEKGSKVEIPSKVEKAGRWSTFYKFVGWYTDSNLTREFNFDSAIEEDLTLYAKWEEKTYDDLNDFYIYNGRLSGYKGNKETVEIPINVTEIDSNSFYSNTKIKKIIIPNTVKIISKNAFDHCLGLETVEIEDGVTEIDDGAFYFCSKLANITLPDSIKVIGSEAFMLCASLKDITIPDGVTTIGKEAFASCFEAKSLVIPDSVTSIGEGAFSNCEKITNITIPKGIKTIAKGAFDGCSSLTNVIIPDNIETIGESAFAHCNALESITLPAGLSELGWNAFYYCKLLVKAYYNGTLEDWIKKTYSFQPDNPYDLYILDTNDNTINNGNEYKLVTAITIPDSIAKDDTINITAAPFYGCKSLTSAIIPDGALSIREMFFYNCPSLRSVTIPETVKNIGSGAFEHCSSLVNITIPDGVKTIGKYAFYECKSLTNMIIPSDVERIEEHTFYGCKALLRITIPNNVTYIGKAAFRGCNKISSIEIPEGVTFIGEEAFMYCSELAKITMPKSLSKIEASTFDGCYELSKITLPTNVEEICKRAFYDCFYLSEIVFPEAVKTIGREAFFGCHYLRSIVIPEGVNSIDGNAFMNCPALSSIKVDEKNQVYNSKNNCDAIINTATNELITGCKNTIIPDGVTSIGECAFFGASGMKSIKIPSTIKKIGNYAFKGCEMLKTVELKAGLISIGEEAFYKCEELKEIKLPDTITDLGKASFYGCKALENVTLPAFITEIKKDSFSYCDALKKISLPNTVKIIEEYAFHSCSLEEIHISQMVEKIYYSSFGFNSIKSVYFDGERKDWDRLAPYIISSKSYTLYIIKNGKVVSSELIQ